MLLGISYDSTKTRGVNKKNADNQMRKLVQQNLPLVFLVPPKLFELKPDGLTTHEIKWLRDNDAPETHFVVGAYEWTAQPLLKILSKLGAR